jgi:hypothetical protein
MVIPYLPKLKHVWKSRNILCGDLLFFQWPVYHIVLLKINLAQSGPKFLRSVPVHISILNELPCNRHSYDYVSCTFTRVAMI